MFKSVLFCKKKKKLPLHLKRRLKIPARYIASRPVDFTSIDNDLLFVNFFNYSDRYHAIQSCHRNLHGPMASSGS